MLAQRETPGGSLRFVGALSEAAIVTIESVAAKVTAADTFEGVAQVTSGTNQVEVKATDYSGNVRTNTYEVDVSGGTTTYSFDANGNLASDGTREFEWDARNQLVAIDVGTRRTEFSYDGLQRRVRSIEKENEAIQSDTHFVWCRWRICEERASDGTTVLRRSFWRGERVLGADRFFASDHLGTVTEVTDPAGNVLGRYNYEPWGERSVSAGSDVTPMGFTAHRWQSNGELWLAQYRAYDPTLGRWLSEDPIGHEGGLNLYSYVQGNPIRYHDRRGLIVAEPTCDCNFSMYAALGCCGIENTFLRECCKDVVDELCRRAPDLCCWTEKNRCIECGNGKSDQEKAEIGAQCEAYFQACNIGFKADCAEGCE